MRILTTVSALALLLTPAIGRAQTPTPAPGPTPTPSSSSTTGSADFGGRSSMFTGDASRYERYRDLGDGLFLDAFRIDRSQSNWFIGASGDHVGRLDQRFSAAVERPGKLKAWGRWDQIPMLMSRSTRTMFIEDIGTSPRILTIPDSIQTQMQNAAAAARPGIFGANSFPFDTQSSRHIGMGGVEYLATSSLTLHADVSSTQRDGVLPYGASFGHSSLVELPAPIQHTLNDVNTSAEYVRGNLLLRGGVTGSWFTNDATTLEFDNPFRATDLAGTPSRGRLSLPPSNTFITGNATASLKLPAHSRATAYVSLGLLRDAGDELMPQTINSVNLPNIQPLSRTRVEGEAHTTGVNLSFTSRPTRRVDFSARYQLYNYNNLTPEFVLGQRVSYDNAPTAATFSTLGGAVSPLVVETEPFGIKRQTFDVEARVRPAGRGAAAVGFTRLMEDRSLRFFEETAENTVRVTYDLTGHQLFSIRAKYEHGQRRGDVTDEAMRELFNIGEQPALRHFDIASRDRDRVTLIGAVTPTGVLSFNGSVAVGRDNYLESTFGLRDNRHRIYAAGVDAVPGEHFVLNASYSYERYDSLQQSRSVASPPSGAAILTFEQFLLMSSSPNPTQAIADSRYDWAANGADRVHSAIASIDLPNLGNKLDLRFAYDFNRARSLYTYAVGADIPLRTLPEDIDPTLTALPPPTQLPLIRSETQRGTFDAVYSISKRFGLGFSYWYEQYRVTDFTLDVDANPDLVRGSALLLGYMYRPYTAQTLWGRVIVRW